MSTNKWRPKLDASQAENLPLVIISLLCVQILSIARDPIVIGWDLPPWLIALDVLLIAILLALAVWVRIGKVADRLIHPIVVVGFVCAGIKSIASIAAQNDPLPFYLAMVMLAGSLCFLSQR